MDQGSAAPTPEAEPPRRRRAAWRLAALSLPAVLLVLGLSWAAVTIIRPAPPDTIYLVSGPEGSLFRSVAERYKTAIERFGVSVQVVASRGSQDNLRRLADPAVKVDVGFVQSGLVEDGKQGDRVSLGTMFAEPLMVYYRLAQPLETLAQLRGKRLAVGPEGSGSRVLALKLLKANGIEGSPTVLVDLGGAAAAVALATGQIDAAFLMGDSATTEVMRSMRDAPGVELMHFRQAA